MSGVVMALLAASGGLNPVSQTWTPTNVHVGVTGIYSATVTWNADGTTSVSAGQVNPGNWYVPTTPSIGSGWSVRITVTSSTNSSVGAMTSGTWYSLASGKGVNFANTGNTLEGTGSANVDFSPDGGTTVYRVGVINWDVGYAA